MANDKKLSRIPPSQRTHTSTCHMSNTCDSRKPHSGERTGPGESPIVNCSGYTWSLDVSGQLQSSLSFLTWSGDGRWRAAALGPCTSCADLQGQTSSWDLNVNSNQRACLLFGTVRIWLALESLRNNLRLYHTPHSLEGMSSFPFLVAHWAVGCKPFQTCLEPWFSLCISYSFVAYGNHRAGT